jgi:hypothetical protein
MANDSNQQKAEDILQQSKKQSRHTAEPSASETEDNESIDRTTAIKEALLAIERREAPENINIRDARLKALLVGIEDADELSDIVEDLETYLETEVDTDAPTQSDVARLLIRVGLQEATPDLLDEAMTARQEALLEQANDF